MTLRLKIYSALGAVSVGAYLVLLSSMSHSDHAASIASAKRVAELMVAQADVADQYTRQEITPLLDSAMQNRMVFIPQSAGFYAVETQGRQIGKALPGYGLRRVVLDATGPDDTPNPWERDMITRLRAPGGRQPFTEIRPGNVLAYVVPLKMTEGVCATCYSSREQAPEAIRDTFGGAQGFNRQNGEVVGATIASVPLTPVAVSGRILPAIILLICWAVACALIEFLLLRPLQRMTAIAERVSMGEKGVEEFKTQSKDEVGALAQSFNRLRRSMESAIELVKS
ncbi:c-type heme family protein [Swingsia samuiensis]|uniref:DUF3365 domain-containing protein n=1 Tax=Swingsia samuiensis TaxID=1293412 RepID=A0A4Y6UH28_9PROT|nr:DUF3365 domain-containing protein [Swingsia samuiensis]QDH16314.1 DUF3365 domain-containing protein [Swingsia samuiensis]